MKKSAKLLRESISPIMEKWEHEVKKTVPAARTTNSIALYDHLPNIIEDIADIMERHIGIEDVSLDNTFYEILENSSHHGRHRANTSNYTVEQVVQEYIIFHRILSEFLKSKLGYNEDVSDLLKYIIETSILKSVGTFSRAIQEMQEKLIGTLAHDIRNPLSVAQLSFELIKSDLEGKWSEKIRSSGEQNVRKALSLIEGLMNGITVKAGEGMMLDFEETNLLEDIEWIQKEANEVYANKIELRCDEKEILGVFDPTAVRRLLENLISNAVKYGTTAEPITITAKNQKDCVIIGVHNNGNPISKEKQSNIFKFLERDNINRSVSNKSWGMGLTLALIVTDAHGGSITLTSNQEEGTLFEVRLVKYFNQPGKRRTKLIDEKEEIPETTDSETLGQ